LGLAFDNGRQEPLSGFARVFRAPNSQGRRVWSLARMSLNVKVKGQRSTSPGTKKRAVWTEWTALVADNVAQAASATSRSLRRGVFAGMRELGLADYRWALARISS